MNEPIHFLNGKFVTEADLLISPRDLGFTRGYAVFDFLRTYGGRPFKLAAHLDRLFQSAALIGLALPWSKDEVHSWVLETLAANTSASEKFIKIIVSGGVANSMLPTGDPTIIIIVDPAAQYPASLYEKGVGVISVLHERYNPVAKSNNYIEGVKQAQRAQDLGALEPLYYTDERVLETSNSNIFAIIDNRLKTPADDVLSGITRSVLLEILKLDIAVEVANFTLEELRNAQEVFLTGSAKEIVPIVAIDGKPVGNGQVGAITKEVMRQFRAYTLSDAW